MLLSVEYRDVKSNRQLQQHIAARHRFVTSSVFKPVEYCRVTLTAHDEAAAQRFRCRVGVDLATGERVQGLAETSSAEGAVDQAFAQALLNLHRSCLINLHRRPGVVRQAHAPIA